MSKKRILRIGIASHTEIQRRALEIARGELKPGPLEPQVWFTSYKAVSQVFSDFNMMLIEIIRDHAPESVTELAELAKRNRPNVVRALSLLKEYNIIEFAEGEQGRKPPRLLYDQIECSTDLRPAA